MARKCTYHLRPLAAISFVGIGLYLCGTDTWSNLEFVRETEGSNSSLVWAVPGVSLAAMFSWVAARAAWKAKMQFEAFILACTLVAATFFSLSATWDRTSQSYVSKIADRDSGNIPYKLAKERRDKAQEAVHKAEEEVAKQEATGRGKLWKEAVAKRKAAKDRLAEAEADMAKAGAPVEADALSATVERLFPGYGWLVPTFQPMLLPAVMYLGGLGFIGVGAGALLDRKPKRKAPVKRKRRTTRKPRKPPAPAVKGVVIPFTR